MFSYTGKERLISLLWIIFYSHSLQDRWNQAGFAIGPQLIHAHTDTHTCTTHSPRCHFHKSALAEVSLGLDATRCDGHDLLWELFLNLHTYQTRIKHRRWAHDLKSLIFILIHLMHKVLLLPCTHAAWSPSLPVPYWETGCSVTAAAS